MLEIETERDIILKCRSDISQFGVLFEEYHPKILRYLIGRVGDVAVANDIASTTFIKAMDNIQNFQPRGFRFSSWLYRIAINETANHFRKPRCASLDQMMENENFDVPALGDPHAEILAAQEEVDKKVRFKQIQKGLALLPLKYQEVISLRFFESKQIAEIAEILGKSDGTVKSLLSRGVKKLKKKCETEPVTAVQPFFAKNVLNIVGVSSP